ncbi:unnamed protein product [Schistocephalus solidus]|uniref:GOLD domain-containing protein n=1 Tax=Schistocephalus solidus TaxID=70667 RepID=A0A183TRN1_SCHSO|nr:unnamed protein product [Schistocephalus solidus]
MRLPSPRSDREGETFFSTENFVSMVVVVRPSSKDCYFYEPETHFDVEFQVLKGDKLDIGLIVIDPNGVPIVLDEFKRRPFAVCLDNRKASYGEKVVYLAIDLRLNWRNPTPEDMQLMNSINFRIGQDKTKEQVRQHIENLERMSDAEILCRVIDQTARETLEAWYAVRTSINCCTILLAAYQALQLRLNQRNRRQ